MTQQILDLLPLHTESLLYVYNNYIVDTYGVEVWNAICSSVVNGHLVLDLILEHGELVFHDLVNLTSKYAGVTIQQILMDVTSLLN